MSDAKFGIDIVADDKTGKGAAAAEKRLGQVGKRVGKLNEQSFVGAERSVARSGKNMVSTFSQVERGAAKAFGNRSIMSGVTARMGGITEASSAMGNGFAMASAEGEGLTGVMGGVGAATAGVVAVMGAAAYAAFKFADSWAKGAASIGRTASIIGVGTKQLQEFTAAAERVGVDRGTATGALGGISQTLNDARYGRNNQALEALRRLGVKMVLNTDGTVNVGAMLPAIANAIQRQNSSGRRTAARLLGIPLEALPAFSQGGAALSSDMADADTHAKMLSDRDIAAGTRIARKSVLNEQGTTRVGSQAAGQVAGAAEPLYDRAVKGITAATDYINDQLAPAARAVNRVPARPRVGSPSGGGWGVGGGVAGAVTGAARSAYDVTTAGASAVAGWIGSALAPGARAAPTVGSGASYGGVGASGLSGGVLSLSAQDVINLKKVLSTEWVPGAGRAQGQGIIDTILNRQASGHWGRTIADVANAKLQFSDVNGPPAWKHGWHSVQGMPMSRINRRSSELVDAYLAERARGARSIVGDNLNYANPSYVTRNNRGWVNALDGPVFGTGNSSHHHGTTSGLQRYRPGEFRVAPPEPIPVTVNVRMTGAPPGTRVTATAGRSKPAVSYAWEPGSHM